MSEQVRNKEQDKRSASLKLHPRPAGTWGKGFMVAPAATDAEIQSHVRVDQCLKLMRR